MRILVVDDEPDICELLAISLRSLGNHDAITAFSGRQALEIIESAKTPFDTILLDIQMPEMNGVEVCKILRARPDYRFVPIIMVTAMTDKDHIDHAFAAGATDYLTKPIELVDLKHRISVAEKSSFQSKALSENARSLQGQSVISESEHSCNLSDAVPIDDVDGVLRVYAFENYLKQMNRFQFHRTRLFLVNAANIETIFNHCTGREFADQVTDIAEGISDALKGYVPFITYFGNGIYCIATGSNYTKDENELLADIDLAIYQLGMVYRNGDPVGVQLAANELVKPSLIALSNSVTFVEDLVRELRSAGSKPMLVELAPNAGLHL